MVLLASSLCRISGLYVFNGFDRSKDFHGLDGCCYGLDDFYDFDGSNILVVFRPLVICEGFADFDGSTA